VTPARRRRWTAPGLALLVALVAGCGAGSGVPAAAGSSSTTGPPAQGTHPHAALRWHRCPPSEAPAGYQCATLSVPLDPAHPDRATIGLALARHEATGPSAGDLLFDPGGPGISGVSDLPALVRALPAAITSRFDVVGFDPPGVGRSDPVRCGNGRALLAWLSMAPAPTTGAGFRRLVAADRRFAGQCEAASGPLLRYVSTVDAARDLDRIRAALGQPKLTYLGFSYGTLLGATYARLYPHGVRAMVLDGALDPALAPIPMLEEQAAALEGDLDAFFRDCSAGGCGWRPPGGPAAAYRRLLAEVTAHPVPVPGSGQSVGPAALLYGTGAALYATDTWRDLGAALAALQHGDGVGVLSLFDSYIGARPGGGLDNADEAEAAVDCLDTPAPSVAQLAAAAPDAEHRAPVFGRLDLYGEAICSVWPVAATGRIAPIRATGAPAIVVVGTTHDPITPYPWARALAAQLGRGVLVTRRGYGHTAYFASACVRRVVDAYLVSARPPKAGTTCPS